MPRKNWQNYTVYMFYCLSVSIHANLQSNGLAVNTYRHSWFIIYSQDFILSKHMSGGNKLIQSEFRHDDNFESQFKGHKSNLLYSSKKNLQ